MTAENKTVWVSEGDAFAGGTLTQQGAAEVNGHRARVLQGEKPVTRKVLDTYYNKPGVKADEVIKAEKALGSTPW